MQRLEAFLTVNGATIYLNIDQQQEFKKAGINIPPFQFLLFGNPKSGAEFVKQNPVAALDLPLKVICWEDNHGKVWLAYNDAAFLEDRHNLTPDADSSLNLHCLLIKAMDIHA